VNARDLLEQARHLATTDRWRPKQANLRRAVSSAYYALFHMLVGEASARLLGRRLARYRAGLGRAFTHEALKATSRAFADGALPGLGALPVPPALVALADTLVQLQTRRHSADYDRAAQFGRTEVLELIEQAEATRVAWRSLRRHEMAELFLLSLLAIKNLRDR
jgi:uncharacterized protein (UPF0332 family)